MKALSIRQPWAWAILNGKDIENRDWPTKFRGRFLVHASKGCTRDEYEDAREFIEGISDLRVPQLSELARGEIVGAVTLVDCVEASESLWFIGRFGFVLRDAVGLVQPVTCKGALGFFEVPLDVEEAVRESARRYGVTRLTPTE